MKKYDQEAASNDIFNALVMTHGIKKSIEHTGVTELVVSEKHAREMLRMISDIASTLGWLTEQYEKEFRDALDRRLEAEEGQ